MRILICKKFFDINVTFFFSGKNIFLGIFFMCLNLVKSQKVIKIFENLFLHVILKINCGILALKNFQFEYFEKLDLYHSPVHCATVPLDTIFYSLLINTFAPISIKEKAKNTAHEVKAF